MTKSRSISFVLSSLLLLQACTDSEIRDSLVPRSNPAQQELQSLPRVTSEASLSLAAPLCEWFVDHKIPIGKLISDNYGSYFQSYSISLETLDCSPGSESIVLAFNRKEMFSGWPELVVNTSFSLSKSEISIEAEGVEYQFKTGPADLDYKPYRYGYLRVNEAKSNTFEVATEDTKAVVKFTIASAWESSGILYTEPTSDRGYGASENRMLSYEGSLSLDLQKKEFSFKLVDIRPHYQERDRRAFIIYDYLYDWMVVQD